jgi:integrase
MAILPFSMLGAVAGVNDAKGLRSGDLLSSHLSHGCGGRLQKLMRHSNVSTTMNVYGNNYLRAKQQASSKVVQMVMRQEQPEEVACS